MPLFETFFQDDAADAPALWAYAADPTVANARALLAAFAIAAPYARLREAKRAASPPPPTAPSARRGGAPAAERLAAAIAIHERADACHDLHADAGVLPRAIARRVLGAAEPALARFPGLRDRLHALADRYLTAPAFTYGVFRALNDAFGLRFAESAVGTIASDRALRDAVARWRAAPAAQPTEIVLDGLVVSPDDASLAGLSEGARKSRLARSQLLCAFVMLMLADYEPAAPLRAAPAPAPAALTFLVGPFQTMDVGGWKAYFARWLASLRDAAPHLWSQLSAAELRAPLKSASGAIVRARDVALPNGRLVPFRAPRGAYDPTRATEAPPPTGLTGAALFRPSFAVATPKAWLRALLDLYRELPAAERAAADPLVDDALAVNALRDAIKADLAIVRGAAFVTYDRLATTYHELRRRAAREAGAPDAPAAVWLWAAGVGDAKLGAYE